MDLKERALAAVAGQGASGSLKRRGLIAGAAALVAGMVARTTTKTAEATDNVAILAGVNNTSTNTTTIARTGGGGSAFTVSSNTGQAITGAGTGAVTGVFGSSDTGNGVYGQSSSTAGTYGTSTGFAGVWGNVSGSAPYGVFGAAVGGTGVYGQSSTGVGMFAFSSSSAGAFGQSVSAQGVQGLSSTNTGVRGDSNSGTGVIGAGGTGVGGNFSGATIGTFTSSGAGIALFAQSTTGTAGRFDGNVTIAGNFEASGTKQAVVTAKDGATRGLFCLEAPQSFFEDVGEARLANGSAQVTIDPAFASVVDLSQTSHIFLTPQGDCNGLFVAERSDSGFTVRELRNGTSSLTFSYRIMAHRADATAARFGVSKSPHSNSVSAPRIDSAPVPPERVSPPPVPNIHH